MELVTIKWLLVAILIAVSIIALSFAAIAVILFYGYGLLKENKISTIFQQRSEQYLSDGEYDNLIDYANERLKNSPQDYNAYWYLGKAQFHNQQFIEAKRNFLKVIELDPTMDYSAGQWIEEIDDKLELGPQLVK